MLDLFVSESIAQKMKKNVKISFEIKLFAIFAGVSSYGRLNKKRYARGA